jgi:hypothetical protein
MAFQFVIDKRQKTLARLSVAIVPFVQNLRNLNLLAVALKLFRYRNLTLKLHITLPDEKKIKSLWLIFTALFANGHQGKILRLPGKEKTMKNTKTYFGKFVFLGVFALVISAINISAATFTVTNTNNSGAGSLRQAVLDSNAAATADTIVFDPAVFGTTPQTITGQDCSRSAATMRREFSASLPAIRLRSME